MATGPEHYREAQEWLTVAANAGSESTEERAIAAACAQAHATLALAAATAMAGRTSNASGVFGMHEADFEAWDAVAGVQEDDDDPYADLTNADVLTADELYEDERAAEAHLDAIDEERYAEANAAYQYGDELDYEDDEDDEDQDDYEDGPF